MLKFLFFDGWEYELIDGFERRLEPAVKQGDAPLFQPTAPWEHGHMSLYGSVIRRPDGLFQLWYSANGLSYLESADGYVWRRPTFNVVKHEGAETNIVLPSVHGPAVFYDADEPRPDWRYKLVSGAPPTGQVCAFRSADGIHWQQAFPNPIVPTNPDSPMSLHRDDAGRYILYVRRGWGNRRVARTESADFEHWSPLHMVLEPEPADPPQLQFYGMGAARYGDYEIGTLWAYQTDVKDTTWNKHVGLQQAELTYCRGGYAWHRTALGQPFLPSGGSGAWDSGNVQCASAPVYCDDEIRFYYAGSTSRHVKGWEKTCSDAGLGLATVQPDRLVALAAAAEPGELVSRAFAIRTPEIFVNANVARDGQVTLELLDAEWQPVPGFRSRPITGNGTTLPVTWQGQRPLDEIVGKPLRFRLRASDARVYSVWMPDGDAQPVYHKFHSSGYLDPLDELKRRHKP